MWTQKYLFDTNVMYYTNMQNSCEHMYTVRQLPTQHNENTPYKKLRNPDSQMIKKGAYSIDYILACSIRMPRADSAGTFRGGGGGIPVHRADLS